jgi:hypothetical protein
MKETPHKERSRDCHGSAGCAELRAQPFIVWIEPDLDLVAVVRWIAADAANDFLGRVLAALR